MIIKDEPLLDEFRAKRCEYCGYHAACPHHLWARGIGGGGRLDIRVNLVALCTVCHTQHHAGNPPYKAVLLNIVAAREGVTVDEIHETVWALRRAPKVRA